MQNNEILEKSDVAGFILKPEASDIIDIYLEIKKIFENHKIKVLLEISGAEQLNISGGIDFDPLCQKVIF